MTKATINAIQFYYSHSLRIHDNVEDMQEGIQAIFDHLTSTDEKPKHDKCKEWCFWVQYEKKRDKEREEWRNDYRKQF